MKTPSNTPMKKTGNLQPRANPPYKADKATNGTKVYTPSQMQSKLGKTGSR